MSSFTLTGTPGEIVSCANLGLDWGSDSRIRYSHIWTVWTTGNAKSGSRITMGTAWMWAIAEHGCAKHDLTATHRKQHVAASNPSAGRFFFPDDVKKKIKNKKKTKTSWKCDCRLAPCALAAKTLDHMYTGVVLPRWVLQWRIAKAGDSSDSFHFRRAPTGGVGGVRGLMCIRWANRGAKKNITPADGPPRGSKPRGCWEVSKSCRPLITSPAFMWNVDEMHSPTSLCPSFPAYKTITCI